MTLERTQDYKLVRQIITDPAIFDALTDDYSAKVTQFNVIESDAVWYLTVYDDDELLGLWVLIPQNAICWDVHTCLLPCSWGPRAEKAAKEAIRWVWENTPCLRLITHVPVYNRLALRFAVKAGMQIFGKNVKSFKKNGVLHDQVLLGISKD